MSQSYGPLRKEQLFPMAAGCVELGLRFEVHQRSSGLGDVYWWLTVFMSDEGGQVGGSAYLADRERAFIPEEDLALMADQALASTEALSMNGVAVVLDYFDKQRQMKGGDMDLEWPFEVESDARFIASAREDVLRLIDQVRYLQGVITEQGEQHA